MVLGSPTKLNLIPSGVMPVVYISQGDAGYDKEFLIYNGDTPYNVPSGVSATIRGTKADNYGVTEAAEVTEGSNLVTVTITEQMVAVAGANLYELVFVNTDGLRVASTNMVWAVKKDALGDSVISESDLDYASQVLDQLQNIVAFKDQLDANTADIERNAGNITSETTARIAADNTLQANITTEASTRSTEDALLQSQIDQLVAPAGSAPSEAEIINARIGADGMTYDTLGNAIRGQVNELGTMMQCAEITEALSLTNSGVTVTNGGDNQIAVYGTATAIRQFGFLNGQNFVKTSSHAFEMTLDAGTYLFESDATGYQSTYLIRATYTTFSNYFRLVDQNQKTKAITFTAPVMIGFTSDSNTNYGTEQSPTYITLTVKRLVPKAVLYDQQSLTTGQAEQARMNIDSVGNDTIYAYNSYDALEYENGTDETLRGVTYTKNADGSWTISGTATGGLSFKSLISSTTSLPRYIVPGRTYKLKMNGGTVPFQVFWYQNGSILSYETYRADADVTAPTGIDGVILRFYVPDGETYNETVKYEFVAVSGGVGTTINNNYSYATTVEKTEQVYNNTYNLSVSPTITTDANGWLQAVDTNTSDETGKTDMTPAIMAMLNSTGYCHLGEGIFYVSGNIDMPEGSKLCGCGDKSIIRLLASVTSGYAVKMEKYCTISDLAINGGYSAPSLSSEGTRIGVLFSANHDGEEGTTAYDSEMCMMSNVWINYFSGSGIKCHNTSTNIRKGLYATNLRIVSCYVGLNIDYYSEFNKFTNACISACTYGCINNGGNNVFTACTFHATQVGFYIDGTQPNSAHGTINGCTFCHIGSNNGVAFRGESISAGFIIANCQFWYNSIEIIDSQGVEFDGCMFGRGIANDGSVSASITVSGGNLVLFSGCMFNMDLTRPPKITITNNSKTRFSGCYGTESGKLISA